MKSRLFFCSITLALLSVSVKGQWVPVYYHEGDLSFTDLPTKAEHFGQPSNNNTETPDRALRYGDVLISVFHGEFVGRVKEISCKYGKPTYEIKFGDTIRTSFETEFTSLTEIDRKGNITSDLINTGRNFFVNVLAKAPQTHESNERVRVSIFKNGVGRDSYLDYKYDFKNRVYEVDVLFDKGVVFVIKYEYMTNSDLIKSITFYNSGGLLLESVYYSWSNNRLSKIVFRKNNSVGCIKEYQYNTHGDLSRIKLSKGLFGNKPMDEDIDAEYIYNITHNYNSEGRKIRSTIEFIIIYQNPYRKIDHDPTIYNYKYDKKGNWIQIDEQEGRHVKTASREIAYWD